MAQLMLLSLSDVLYFWIITSKRRRPVPNRVVFFSYYYYYYHHHHHHHHYCKLEVRYSYSLLYGRSVDRIPLGGWIFRTRPNRLRGLPSFLYHGYRVSSPGMKRPGRGIDHASPSSAEVKGRVQPYPYFPSGPSWQVVW